jgi:hypothetical protein
MSDIWNSFTKLRRELIGSDQFSKGVYNNHYQRVLFNAKGRESSMRFLIKALICKILYDNNNSFVSEWKYIINNKVFDNLPIVDVDNNIIIRFGSSKLEVKHKNFDEININLSSLNLDFKFLKELEDKLRERIKDACKIQEPKRRKKV